MRRPRTSTPAAEAALKGDGLIEIDHSWLESEPITEDEIAAAHAAIEESKHDDSTSKPERE